MAQGFVSVSNAGLLSPVSSNFAQGLGQAQRIGDSIDITHIDLKIGWQYGDVFNRGRTILLYCPGTPGTPVVTTYLQNGPLAVAPDPFSFLMPGLVQSGVIVLYDNMFDVSQNYRPTQEDFVRIKVGRRFTYAPGTTTSINGEIYFLHISDSSAAPHPGAILNANFYFRDVTY
jgi:hypothetical protein